MGQEECACEEDRFGERENTGMGKYRETVRVAEQTELSAGIFSLWIETKEIAREAKAGQFLSLYSRDESRMLPRPISICTIDREENRLRLVYRVAGGGTREFSGLKEGDTLEVVGPLGNGFPLSEKKALLIGGGIGIPPMVELARELNCEKAFVMGYRTDDRFLKEELEELGTVYYATEDGSYGVKGNVLDAVREYGLKAEVLYACGPTPMLRAIQAYAREHGLTCYLSLEERMACGIGACLACVCKSMDVDAHTYVKNKRICKEGPVFEGSEVDLSPWVSQEPAVSEKKAEEAKAGREERTAGRISQEERTAGKEFQENILGRTGAEWEEVRS